MKFVMSDARAFTDYSSSCEINNTIQKEYNAKNEHDYRFVLQNKATQLMTKFATFSDTKCKFCPGCMEAMLYNGSPLKK
jgi:hypothetical protein